MNVSSQPSHNDELIQKLTQIVLENIDNEQFGVSELAEQVGMNRSHLYRKIIVLTKKSLSQFIREIRLSEALKLLKKESVTVSEVAYRVGFNNPSYFNSCFHDHYGFPPGEAKHRSLKNTLQHTKGEEKPVIPNAWRIAIYVSIVVIIGLVVMTIIGRSKQIRPREIQTLLILPYQNYTGDDQLDILLSGMHSALINDVGRIHNLIVISKTTSDVYKDSDKTLSQIAEELGADAIIEPGVMCAGDTVCFQLAMNTPNEEQLWIAEYSESKSQVSNIHNRITKQIAVELKIELTADQASVLAERRTIDPEAVDAYMKGLFYLDKIDRDGIQKAREYFSIAIKIEPDWAPPYTGMAGVWGYQKQMSFIPPSVAIPKIYENLNRALELDSNSSNAHYSKAIIAVWTEWNWEKGEEEFKKSLEANPSNAMCRMFYGHLLNILSRPDEALYQANQALKLDPQRPFILGLYAALMNQMGDYQSAINYNLKALSIDSTHRFAIVNLSVAYRNVGDYEKWFEEWKKIAGARYGDKVVASIDSVFQDEGYHAATKMILKIDEEAAKEKQIYISGQVNRYMEIKEYDKAMDWLEKGYEIQSPSMPYMGKFMIWYEQLNDNPRYIELLKKMNLSLP